MDKEGNVTMEDAAGFFANVFGGERFMAYVSRSPEPIHCGGPDIPLR